MASKTEVITNFCKQTGKCRNGSKSRFGGFNIFYEDRVLYSYGYHFPLAIRHEDASDDGAACFGAGIKYIINGDKYSVSTTSHQNECISTLKGNVQIPFSALEQAYNWASLKASGFDKAQEKCKNLERHEVRSYIDSDEYNNAYQTWIDYQVRFAQSLACKLRDGMGGFQVVAWNNDEWRHTHDDGKTWGDGYFGEWIAGANNVEVTCNQCWQVFSPEPEASPRSEHRLGAVLFKIRDHYFLSSFDALDRRNYFLCQVPGSPSTVEEAYECLKPLEVKLCEKAGATILRQGDWFFYQAAEPSGELAKWLKQQAKTETKQYRLGGTSGTHMVTRMRQESPEHAMLLVSGTVKHSPTDGRRPEHKRLKLGDSKTWWIPVKNTSKAGWGAVGNVD